MPKATVVKGCEWAGYIGPSDATLRALLTAQNDKEHYTDDERREIRRDRERIAAQDQNYVDNCI